MNINNLFTQKNTQVNDKLNTILKNYVHHITSIDKSSLGNNFDFFKYDEEIHEHLNSETVAGLKSLMVYINNLSTELNHLKNQTASLETFLELYRDSDHVNFYDDFLKLLSKRLNAWQSILFLKEQEHLKAHTGYAFETRGQLIQKGEGLVGQCFKEGKTISMQSNGGKYFEVNSGLGNSKTVYVLILPVLYGEEIMGVLEFSCFQNISSTSIEFAEKVCNYLGSVIYNKNSTERNRQLIQEAQERTNQLMEHEEQLRQNIEELNASQEEMEVKKVIIDQQSQLMKMIVDYIPFPVFVKDDEGRYTLINKAEAELLGKAENEILGKNDYHFVQNESEWEVIKKSDQRVLSSEHPVELKEQEFTTPDGKTYLFKTTKVPFVNNITGKKNILGVSIDLSTFNYRGTEKKEAQATNS